MNFNEKTIKKLRHRLGWSQQQLADELCVSRRTAKMLQIEIITQTKKNHKMIFVQ